MNILEDLPYDIDYIEPNNYINDFVLLIYIMILTKVWWDF